MFKPGRGLRQGDPLSPYLYILRAEAFTKNATKLASSTRMLFPKIEPNGDRVGLLQFADNLLFFLGPNSQTLPSLNHILSLFEEEARQCINRSKSQLLFSKNATGL